MRRRLVAILGLIVAGAGMLLAGYLGLTPLPLTLDQQASPSTAATAPASSPAIARAAVDAPAAVKKTPARSETPPDAASAEEETALDISRISPDGASVFAGRAKPGAYVTLRENGNAVGSAKADEKGEWSLVTEHRFASLDPNLSLEASDEAPAEVTVAEATPETAAGSVGVPKPEAPTAKAAPSAGAAAKPSDSDAPRGPAAAMIKNFESMVAEAREEAKRESEGAAPAPAATMPSEQGDASSAAAGAEIPTTSSVSPRADAPAAPGSTAEVTAAAPAAASSPAQSETSIPVPITFIYNEANLTRDGQHAAELLLEYLKLKHLAEVTLSGHADERGTNGYNMDLSRERLDAVARLLRDGGFTGRLELVPKGEAEPFAGVDRTSVATDDLYQLDRRVELRFMR